MQCKLNIFTILHLGLYRSHGVDCVQQVFQQRFDHADNLEALEIHLSNMNL